MNRLLIVCGLAIILTGCTGKSANNANNSNAGKPTTPVRGPSDPATVSPEGSGKSQTSAAGDADLSTPKSAVETFIKAAERSDIDVLSQCLDASAPDEFKRLRDKTATPDDLQQLADQVGGGLVLDVVENGDAATVKAKLPKGMDEIKMKRSNGLWKIVAF